MIAELFQSVLEERRDVAGAGVNEFFAVEIPRLNEDSRYRLF